MSYATVQDLIARYGETELIQLTDRENAGVVDDTVAQQALDDASAEVDGYLGGRYQLPLATVPSVLERLTCVIARYQLFDFAAPEEVRNRHKDAVRFLEGVAKGHVSLGLSEAGQTPNQGDVATVTSGGRAFGRDEVW